MGICDTLDGQCACKGNVVKRECNECKDGFFGLDANHGLGCTHCQCDPGGTEVTQGDSISPICDKDSGQCTCRGGMDGRQCNEVNDL